MSDDPTLNHLLAEARERVKVRPALAATAEAQAAQWKQQLASDPPMTEADRKHYREKAVEFRQLAHAQLENVRDAGAMIGRLVTHIEEVRAAEQIAVLRDQLAPVLENEATTVRALASVLEVCLMIDERT